LKSLAHAVAGAFGLTGFAVAGVAGVAAGNSAERVLIFAVGAMVGCNLLGNAMGGILEKLVEQHLETYKRERPTEDDPQRAEVMAAPETATAGR